MSNVADLKRIAPPVITVVNYTLRLPEPLRAEHSAIEFADAVARASALHFQDLPKSEE